MTNKINILGENTRQIRYNPDLASQMTRRIEEEEQRALIENKTKKPKKIPTRNSFPDMINNNIPCKENYVYVPNLKLYISKEKYHQGINWKDTQDILHKQGKRMPTIPEFIEFVKYLRSPKGKVNVSGVDEILDEIFTIRNQFRGEWLDARFEINNGTMYVFSHRYFNNNGEIIKIKENLEKYIVHNLISGINLKLWLKDPTSQGLPKANCLNGKFHYWSPKDNCVAGIQANPYGTGLFCDKSVTHSEPTLGVRYVEPLN